MSMQQVRFRIHKIWFNEQSKKDHFIIFINANANSSKGANLVGAVQYAIDPIALVTDTRHSIEKQVSGGCGITAGAGATFGGDIGVLYARDISNLEGYATEVGGTVAVYGGLSGGMVITGEATEETHYYGGYIGIDGGAAAEFHVNMLATAPTFYPIDFYLNIWGIR